MALTLISLLALSAYTIGTSPGYVQKSILHQFTPVPKTNTRSACWYTANICKSHSGNETLTHIICIGVARHQFWHLPHTAAGGCVTELGCVSIHLRDKKKSDSSL